MLQFSKILEGNDEIQQNKNFKYSDHSIFRLCIQLTEKG